MARSTTLDVLARVGFIAFAVIHLLVAWIVVRILRGEPAHEGDPTGAFALLADQPGGTALLWAAVVGLAALTVWQLLEAATGHRDEQDSARTRERLISVGRTIVYGFLGWTAARFVTGDAHSSAEEQQGATSTVLSSAGGRALVVVIGLAIVALSLGLLWYGLTARFERHLKTGEMRGRTRSVARGLGRFGYAAKGVAYAIVGVLLVSAAATYDPAKSRGLDGALRTLAAKPYGPLVLAIAALGFAAFGAYCLVQARYRKV